MDSFAELYMAHILTRCNRNKTGIQWGNWTFFIITRYMIVMLKNVQFPHWIPVLFLLQRFIFNDWIHAKKKPQTLPSPNNSVNDHCSTASSTPENILVKGFIRLIIAKTVPTPPCMARCTRYFVELLGTSGPYLKRSRT